MLLSQIWCCFTFFLFLPCISTPSTSFCILRGSDTGADHCSAGSGWERSRYGSGDGPGFDRVWLLCQLCWTGKPSKTIQSKQFYLLEETCTHFFYFFLLTSGPMSWARQVRPRCLFHSMAVNTSTSSQNRSRSPFQETCQVSSIKLTRTFLFFL